MICTSIQNASLEKILEIIGRPEVEMAEIRLDLCPLSDDEIIYLFSETDIPLIATCRISNVGEEVCRRKLALALDAGARYADLELEASASLSRYLQKLTAEYGSELIRSFHDFEGTPSKELLLQILGRCYRYGASIAKIAVTATSDEDIAAVESLYEAQLPDGKNVRKASLIAFAMGEKGRGSRMASLKAGAPFIYAYPDGEEKTAPGQSDSTALYRQLYHGLTPFVCSNPPMPSSKSFAQRAIIAAALAQGTSTLRGYTPCDDSEAALDVARALGAEVAVKEDIITIKGIGPINGRLSVSKLNVRESGLLARLMIPLLAALNDGPATIEGEGTLLRRPLEGASDIMAAFGVLVKERTVPVQIKGQLIPGRADVPGQGGSQLISGLLMALPLCAKDSELYVEEPKSIPYMYITLEVLRKFGIFISSEMEGDASMLEQQDWSDCSEIGFKIKGRMQYKAADIDLEKDWSAAANFLVAAAVFGSADIRGLDTASLQADLTISDILVEAGADVSLYDGSVCVRKAPLSSIDTDLSHSPDLFPIVSILCAFCPGTSRLTGLGRLCGKESNRAEAILSMLEGLGVKASARDDVLEIEGESLSSRILNGRLLKGGRFSSRSDHRMVMALKVASLGADSPIEIDDTQCVSKSFPDFSKLFDKQ